MSSQVRNFIISFIIATLIFSSVAVFGVSLIDKYVLNPEPDITAQETDDSSLIPETAISTGMISGVGSGTSFSFVLIGSDYQPDIYSDYDKTEDGKLNVTRKKHADTVIFGMFNKELNEFVICPINPQSLVLVDGVKMTLAESYEYKDEKFICDKVSVMIGFSVDYYASVNIKSLVEIIDYIGGVEYDVANDLTYVNEAENINISLKKGKQKLNGVQSLALLRYNDYDNKESRMNISADYCLSVIKQMTADYLNKYKYPTMYEYFSSRVKTNYTLAAIERNIELIFKFSSMSVSYITYPGTFSQEGFVPDNEKGVEIFIKYR